MLSKSDILSMLADLGACQDQDLRILKQDPRTLEQIYSDPRAQHESGEVLTREDIMPECHAPCDNYVYDVQWIVDGPCGKNGSWWTDYTYDELIGIIQKEHELWRTNYNEWVRRGGNGMVLSSSNK
jgi:hypothetical protein